MATKFFPERLIYVPATGGHPPSTEYRVGIGPEHWDKPILVKKVQMVYENKINGRVAPSFPIKSQYDEDAVRLAMTLLDKGEGTNNPHKKIVVTVSETKGEIELDTLEEKYSEYVHNFYLNLAPAMTVVDVDFKDSVKITDTLVGFIFEVGFSY